MAFCFNDSKYQLRSSGMHRKQNLEIVFGFKIDAAVSTFTFRFLPSTLLSLFPPPPPHPSPAQVVSIQVYSVDV